MKGAAGWTRRLASFPITAPALLLLLLLSSAWLMHVARRESPQRDSLTEQLDLLSSSLVMLQSFEVDSATSAPEFWSERLGQDQATQLWSGSKGRIWWKGWLPSGSSVLVLPRQQPSTANNNPLNQRLPGLELVFSDSAERSSFTESLPLQPSEASPLERFCLSALENSTAVRWTPEALLPMAGPLATMLSAASHGCLVLNVGAKDLRWSGVFASRSLREAPRRLKPPNEPSALAAGGARVPWKPDPSLLPMLQLDSATAEPVLGGLLNRPLIRDGLEKDYGLTLAMRRQLLEVPMRLSVEPQSQGPFQARVQIDLQLPYRDPEVRRALELTSTRLEKQGFRRRQVDLVHPDGQTVNRATLWLDEEKDSGRVLGGWTWLPRETGKRRPALLRMVLAGAPTLKRSEKAGFGSDSSISLMLSPRDLVTHGLLPVSWPSVVRSADRLMFRTLPLSGQTARDDSWRWVQGQLDVS
jgi:hypothetical protein